MPKFIHILSTKLTKCAIYKAKMFAFRLITYVHYIITNNNAIFAAVRRVPCSCVEVWILFKCGYIRFMLYSLYSVFNVQDTI